METTATTSFSVLRHYTHLPTLHVVTPSSSSSSSLTTTTTKSKPPSSLSATKITSHFHSTTFPFLSYSTATSQRKNDGVFSASADASASAADNDPIAILLEVEGVVMDVYRQGNRQAFNLAFQKLGLDCASWTEPIYLDLIRKAYGDEEKMLMLFFNRIGWPTSLPTNEKEKFMKSVIREKRNALDEFVISKSLPLRPGLEDFIDDALVGGIPVIILTAYCHNEDKLARSIIEKLGEDRASRIKIVGKEEVEGSFYGQLVLNKVESASLDEQLAEQVKKAADAEKQRIANEVASLLKVSVNLGNGTTESFDKNVATLRAGAEYAGAAVQNCVLIAGSQSGLLGAERIGMPCIVLRSSLTSRTEFPSANAVMDGFGGADLTISKLRQKARS